MEEYVDYLKGKIQERAGRYARICVCLQRSTKYLFKFHDATPEAESIVT
jgi:hypothetical protein